MLLVAAYLRLTGALVTRVRDAASQAPIVGRVMELLIGRAVTAVFGLESDRFTIALAFVLFVGP